MQKHVHILLRKSPSLNQYEFPHPSSETKTPRDTPSFRLLSPLFVSMQASALAALDRFPWPLLSNPRWATTRRPRVPGPDVSGSEGTRELRGSLVFGGLVEPCWVFCDRDRGWRGRDGRPAAASQRFRAPRSPEAQGGSHPSSERSLTDEGSNPRVRSLVPRPTRRTVHHSPSRRRHHGSSNTNPRVQQLFPRVPRCEWFRWAKRRAEPGVG